MSGTEQIGDVYLFNTENNGDIEIDADGFFCMSPSPETASYLSLFGGNDDDDGSKDNLLQWWGNSTTLDESKQYRSETQHLLRSLPATSNNLVKLELAAERDHAWLLIDGYATEVSATARLLDRNMINLLIEIVTTDSLKTAISYTESWTQ